MRKYLLKFFVVIVSLFHLSCGIGAFYFLDSVVQRGDEIIGADDANLTRIRLPRDDSDGYADLFRHFVIFYRIYISGYFAAVIPQDGEAGATMDRIHPQLRTDFNHFLRYTNIDNPNVTPFNNRLSFYNRRYFQLLLEDADIDQILNNSVLSNSNREVHLIIEFPVPPTSEPTLTLEATNLATGATDIIAGPYNLLRAEDWPGGFFEPEPANRLFQNHPDLNNNENAFAQPATFSGINDDTVRNTAVPADHIPRLTYVSMYILAEGLDMEVPRQPVFSQPAHIGVFRLPDSH